MAEPIRVSPWVTHERLDDEVIAINLETGAYYALDGVAADCWVLSAAGSEIDELVAAVTERYDVAGVPSPRRRHHLPRELVTERLMVVRRGRAGTGVPLSPLAAKKPYAAPAVENTTISRSAAARPDPRGRRSRVAGRAGRLTCSSPHSK